MKEFAQRWLGDENKVEFIRVTSENREEKLADGDVDIVAASMTHSMKVGSQDLIDYSQFYYFDRQGLLIPKELENEIVGFQDLSGKKIAVIRGSTTEVNVATTIEYEAELREVDNVTTQKEQNFDEAFGALANGEAQVFTTDKTALAWIVENVPNYVLLEETFTEEPYAVGVTQGDYLFEELVNATLQQMKQDGTYDALYMKWFGTETDGERLLQTEPYKVQILPGDPTYLPNTVPFESNHSNLRLIRLRANPLKDDGVTRLTVIAGVKFDLPPFGELKSNGELDGFDVELMENIGTVLEEMINDELQAEGQSVDVVVKFRQVTSDDRIKMLQNRQVDILAASMTRNWEREELIDFSQTYFVARQAILVEADSDINRFEDLDGKTVGALKGSTSIRNIEFVAEKAGINITIETARTSNELLRRLTTSDENQKIDAFTTDAPVLEWLANNDQMSRFRVVEDNRFKAEPYGLGVPEGDKDFQILINCALQKLAEREIKADGTLEEKSRYEQIYEDWFGDNKPPYEIEQWGECPITYAEGDDYLASSP